MNQFFSALFDFSFSKFVTPKIASFVYGVAVVAAALQSLVIVIAMKLMGVIPAIISFLSLVIVARVSIEVSLAIFKVAKYTREIAHQGRTAQSKLGSHPPPPIA
jgi:hypothetical protein